MIPESIVHYLRHHNVRFTRHWHPRAVSAQKVAAALHVTGYRVAKSVLVEVDGRKLIAVAPAVELIDLDRLASVLGASRARLLDESEFAGLFEHCEVGAEAPFGRLYGLPVVVDSSLAEWPSILLRAGSHEETLEMTYQDFVALEQPIVASIGRPAQAVPAAREEAVHP